MIYLNTIMTSVYLVQGINLSSGGGIRIVLDGNKISESFVIKPVSYSKFNKTQSEERIFTNDEVFPIFDYIIRIDILDHLVGDDKFDDIVKLLDDMGMVYNLVSRF